MRKPTSIIMVVCGILVLVGLFLSWYSVMGFSSSGWDMISNAGIDDAFGQLLVLIGALIMIGCSGMVLINSLRGKGTLRTLRTLEIVSLVGATMAVSVAFPALIQQAAGDASMGDTGAGLYLCAILGLVAVVVGAVAATTPTKKKAG
jgi:hypothetical protein